MPETSNVGCVSSCIVVQYTDNLGVNQGIVCEDNGLRLCRKSPNDMNMSAPEPSNHTYIVMASSYRYISLLVSSAITM